MEEEDPVGAYIGGCDPKGNALADRRPLYGGCSYVGYLTTFKNIQPETRQEHSTQTYNKYKTLHLLS